MATTTEQRKIEIIANGQKVNASLKEMKASAALLNNQLEKMTPGTDAFVKKSKDLQGVRERMANVKEQMYGTRRAQDSLTKGTALLRRGFNLAVKAFLPLFAFQKIQELVTGLFNLESQWTKLKGTIEQTSNLQGQAVDDAAIRTQAIANTFGQDNTRIFESAKKLVTNFKISYDEAFTIVEQGLVAAGTKGDEFLEQIGEYSVQFADAGASAEGFAVQSVKAINDGIYSDKGADVVKEFGLRIREQTNASKDALEAAFGQQFTKDLFDNINNGSITTVDALKLVSNQMNSTQIPANKLQTVVADVFGGPGEDAGLDYLKSLKDIGGEMEDLIDSNNDYTQRQQARLELEKELATAQEALTAQFQGSSGVFSNLILQAKILFFDTLARGIEIGRTTIVGLVNYFIDLYNESNVVRAGVALLKAQFKTAFEFAKTQVVTLIDIFKSLGSIWKAIFTGNFDDILGLVSGAFEKIKGNYSDFGKEAAQNYRDAAKEVVSREKIALIEIDTETPVEQAQDTGKAIVAANTQARQELAASNAEYRKLEAEAEKALEDLRLSLMQEGEAQRLEESRISFERDMVDLQQRREAIIANDKLTWEQRKELQELIDEEEALLREERKARDEEIRLEEKEAEIEREFEEFDEALERELLLEENRQLALSAQQEQNFTNLFNKEFEREQALLDLRKRFLDAKLEVLAQNGKSETTEALKLKNELLKIEKEKADSAIEQSQREADFKQFVIDSGLESAKEALEGTLDILGEESQARKAASVAMKTVQVAQTTRSTYASATAAYEAMAGIPIVGPALGAAAAAAAILSGLSNLKKITATKYARGGKTGQTLQMVLRNGMYEYAGRQVQNVGTYVSGGAVNEPSLGLIGEEGPEWVGPNWMIRSPKYANIFSFLESERLKATPFVEGGPTSSAIPAFTDTNAQAEEQVEKMDILIEKLDFYASRVDEWASALKVINDPNETEAALIARNEVDAESTITR